MPKLTFGGGLNEQDDINIAADECISGQNFLLSKAQRSYRPRQPFDKKGTAPNAGDVRGIMQLSKKDGSMTTLVQAGAIVYGVDSSFVFTNMGACTATSKLRGNTWALDEVMVITDLQKQTVVKQWDGATYSTLVHGIGGVTNLYAKYAVEFNGRMLYLNITTDTTNLPHLIYATAFQTYKSFDTTKRSGDATFTTGNEAFYITTPDLKEINGVAVFYKTLIISTVDGRLFRLTGDDSKTYNFEEFYPGSAAIGDEAIVNTGNDVMFVRRGGHIDFLTATQSYGDVSVADASKWIPTSTASISSCISVYDRTTQRVYFFIPNKILVFDKEIYYTGEFSPWSAYTTNMPSNLTCNAAVFLKAPSDGSYTLYFGDNVGNIYDLNGVGTGDAGTYPINTSRKTRLISDEELDELRNRFVARCVYRRRGSMTMQCDIEWEDEGVVTTATIPLKDPLVTAGTVFYGSVASPSYYGDDGSADPSSTKAYYSQGGVSDNQVSTMGFDPPGKGRAMFITLSASTTVQFLVNRIEA